MAKKKACAVLFLLIAVSAFLPALSAFAAEKPETVDPYTYFEVSSAEEVMELIGYRSDAQGNPLYDVSRLTFDVYQSEIIYSASRDTEEFYKLADGNIGFSGKVDVDISNNFTAEFPFNTGEYIFMDESHYFYSVSYEGVIRIICKAIMETDEKALYELGCRFIGNITEKETQSDGVIKTTSQVRGEDNPMGVAIRYTADALPPSYSESKESMKDVLLKIKTSFSPVEWVVRMKLASMDIVKFSAQRNDAAVDTNAASRPGESSLSIPEAVAIAILGGGAAFLGSGTDGSEGDEKAKKKNRYEMRLKKDFGDSIYIGAPPVLVFARIVEITPEGTENSRPDLSAMIKISSADFEVGGTSISGEYIGAEISLRDKPAGDTGVVSFCFSGGQGSFTNNVSFKIAGDPYIEYHGHKGTNQLFILAASGRTFALKCRAVDFPVPPVLSINDGYPEFSMQIEPVDDYNYNILVTDTSEKPQNLEQLTKGFDVELSAAYGKETYTSRFTVILCYEGLAANFWGKAKEIRGYAEEDGEMAKTDIGFSLGVWNDTEQVLERQAPQDIGVQFEDEKDIYRLIGIMIKRDEDSPLSDTTSFIFQAEKPYPSLSAVSGKLSAISGEYSYETKMTLLPDIQKYSDDFQKEYEACRYTIETYMPVEYRKSRLESLELNRYLLGIEDLKIFRKECWNIAHDCIIKERDSYLNEALWYDRAITVANVVSFIGDIAFDLALAPIGGPITGFLAGQVKSTVVELVTIIQEKPEMGIIDIGWELIQNRLVQTVGSADGVFDMPDLKKPKELVVWLTYYALYRFAFHWQFDKDDAGNPAGIYEAVKSTGLDLTGKAAGALLGDYVNKAAKGRWPEKISVKEADEELTKKIAGKTSTALREGAEKLADKATGAARDTMEYVTDIFLKYLEKLKAGE